MTECWKLVAIGLVALLGITGMSTSVSARTANRGANGALIAPVTALPDSPVGRQVAWIVSGLAPGSSALTEAEFVDHFTPGFLDGTSLADAVGSATQFAEAYGPVALAGFVRPPTDTQAVAFVTTQTGDGFLLVVGVEAAEPGHIEQLSLELAPIGLAALVAAGGAVGGLTDIGQGRRLYLACVGPAFAEGGPSVVFEAGHGGDSTAWLATQSILAPDVRTCAYDRSNAPEGASDPAPLPRTGQDVVTDLHALLHAAGVPGPYVLSGHSLGGLFARLYASAYPEDVAGLVLVDPSHEDQDARFEELVGPDLWAAYAGSAAGFADPEGFDFAGIGAEVRTAQAERPIQAMPLVVLTRGLAVDAAHFPAGWPTDAIEALWRSMHADTAGLVPGGQLVVASESGHDIQLDQPQLVADTIQSVLLAIPHSGASPDIGRQPESAA